MYSVPVQADSQHGIGELKGVLRFDGHRLTLQYQLADPILAEFRTAPVELELPADALVNARYRAGFLWLRPSIELRASDIGTIATLPAEEAGRLRFRVPRGERVDARKIVDGVNAICAEVRFARLNDSINRMTASTPEVTMQPAPGAAAARRGADGESQ